MMKLIIAEKPSLGRAIKEWLANKAKTDLNYSQYQVTWLFGHMLELDEPEDYDPKYKSWNTNLLPIKPAQFKLHIKKDEGIKKQVALIKLMLQNVTEVINAGDPDREGQLLVDELLDHFDNKKPVKRLWLSAIDDKSIERAFSSIKNNSEYLGYKLAAQTRSQADWLVGMNYSRALSSVFKNYGYTTISIGRVQTPTLKLIVDRDNEIKNFVSKDFFELAGLFADSNVSLAARLVLPESIKTLLDDENRLLDKQPLIEIANAIINKVGVVTSYTKESKTTRQPLLFNLSELQAVVNKKLGYSAQEVLDTAQILYENKLTSYPRSDCQYMPESQHSDAAEILKELLNLGQFTQLTPTATIKSAVWNDAKITAHHAIVPTGSNMAALRNLGEKERNIFNIIAIQYLMQFYPELSYDEVEILINIEQYHFKAIGKTIMDLGWKKLATASDDDDSAKDEKEELLPVLVKGQALTCTKADIITKKTQKPKPYSEGTLIKSMQNIHNKIADLVKAEGHDEVTATRLIKEYRGSLKETAGLGTEATRANIIETLKKREFIVMNKKAINATELGNLLIFALVNDPTIRTELGFLASPLTTARYEQYLDVIQNKAGKPETLLANLETNLDKLTNFAKLQFNLPFQKDSLKCNKCNAGALIKLNGKFGTYWKCPACNTNFNDKDGKPILTDSKPAAVSTGEKCPDCSSNLVERTGKFGKFIACSGYPKCKWTPPKISVKAD
jgi:DNA topoisomerase III